MIVGRGNRRVRHFVTANSTLASLGLNPGFRDEKPSVKFFDTTLIFSTSSTVNCSQL
jgi:hypothetical protein